MNTSKKLAHTYTSGNITTRVYNHLNTGSCQCTKDCDCMRLKGKIMYQIKTYSNPLAFKPNGKPKEFKTIKDCMSSYKALSNPLNLNK